MGMSACSTDHTFIVAWIIVAWIDERPALRWLLEGFRESGLLERVICPMAGFNVMVDHEPTIANRAVPDFMITLAVPHKGAAAVS
jgi:hypothetical protein